MKAIFIDIDNTLLDFDAYVRESMSAGFARFGLRPYEPWMYDIFVRENDKLWQAIERSELTFARLQEIRWNTVFRALGIEADGIAFERYFREALHESAIPVPGAHELLEQLHGRFLLCAASNGPYAQQVHRLELSDMRKYFDYLFISEKIGVSKPSRAFYDAAFAELNAGRAEPIRPCETLMLGDSPTSDMAGGLQYGMRTCFFRRHPDKPAPAGVDTVVADLPQALREILALAER